MFNRVVSYGCSFTAGGELLDHELLPDAEEFKKIHGSKHFIDVFGKERQDPNFLKKQNSLAWPGRLAESLGVELTNNALDGSSLQAQMYYFERDFDTFKKDDLIVFGVPRWKRDCYFEPDWEEGSDLISYISPIRRKNMFWNWLQYLHRLVVLSEKTESKVLLFLMHKRKLWPLETDVIFKKYFTELYNHENFRSERIWDFGDDTEVHANGHPKKEVHDRFADYILSEIL